MTDIKVGRSYKGNSGVIVLVVGLDANLVSYTIPEFNMRQTSTRKVFENWAVEEIIGNLRKVRKTWKHTLSPEKNAERIKQMQFCKKVRKALGEEYEVTFYFNPGGPAVWGETWVKVHKVEWPRTEPAPVKLPVVEACLSHDFSYIRQWDGNHSGRNIPIRVLESAEVTLREFVRTVQNLSSQPFRRF